MKPSAMFKTDMDGEPDLNAEIERELALIEDDDPSLQEDGSVDGEETIATDGHISNENDLQEITLPYLERVQSRTGAFEKCLEECDELLKKIDTNKTEKNPDESFLTLAQENGVEDVEAFRTMIISEAHQLEKEEETLKSARNIKVTKNDDLKIFETSETNGVDSIEADGVSNSENVRANESEMDQSKFEIGDENGETEALNNNNSDEGQTDDLHHANGDISEGKENALDEFEQWTEKWLTKKMQRKLVEEDEKKKEAEKFVVIEKRRAEKLRELEMQQQNVAQHQQEIEEKLNKEMEEEEKKIKESLEIYQAEINKLAEDIAEEQKSLAKQQEEQRQQNEEKRNKSATKIQSFWKGYRARKLHGDVLKEKIAKMKAEKELAMMREIEERRKEMERAKEEQKRLKEEKVQKEREEQLKLEEMKKKEEERLQKEMRAKEEKGRRETEEKEKREKEESERKEREEKERMEKEEQERLQKEKEEKGKKERLEEEKRKEREIKEKEEKEEKERRENEEKVKREREEQLEKERRERERQEEERIKKEEERKQKEMEQRKKEEERRKKVEEERRKQEEMKKREEEAAKKRERERKLQLMMTLPKELESMRLAWMKGCQPWSKSKQELKRRKPSSGKKQLRRPLSAKKLPLIKEEIILSAAQASSLQQITTVELKDLPGFSTVPLGGCKSLKHLVINNCHLVAVEGFEQHTSLQYLDLKNNNIEALYLMDVVSLSWLDVSHNNLSSIHGLEGCQNIRHLDLSHNRITRIACTEWLTSLHTLDLSHNQLITTKGLSLMTTLQELNLASNHLANIEVIEPLSLLTTLDASSNNLLQIPSFENQVLLRYLNFQDNSLSSVDEFSTAWLPLLHTLILSNNGFTELSSLSTLVSLKKLDVSHNQLIDLESIIPGIEECRQLCHLYLEENPITEENNYRALLKEQVPTLQEVDGTLVSKNTDADIEESLTGFEMMCRCQNEICEKLKATYNEVRRKDIPVGEELLRLHLAFIEEDLRLAEEHRFAHEFGSISSHLDTTLKVNLKDIVKKSSKRKVSSGATSVASAESQMQNASVKNKNKFEEALSKVTPKPPSTPKTQPTRNLNQGSKPSVSSPSKSNVDVTKTSEEQSEDLSSSKDLQTPHIPQGQGQSSRSKGHSGTQGSVSASTVQKILQSEQTDLKPSILQNRAATIIQAYWRGYSVRQDIDRLTKSSLAATVIQAAYRGRRFRESLTQYLWPGRDIRVLNNASVKIQALWRGYVLRKRLQQALDYARMESGEILEDEEFPEVDLDDFNFDEEGLNQGWAPPETPQLPASHAVLKGPSNEKKWNGDSRDHPGGSTGQADMASKVHLFQKSQLPQVPNVPMYAWEKSDSRLYHQEETSPSNGKPPLPPLSRFSDAISDVTLPAGLGETNRTNTSRRTDKLAEEWGFKDSRTAELMLARAKKLKYNAQRKQKFSQLDPKQRLALYRKLEENSRVKPIQLPPKKSVPRKEYFQARAEELRTEEIKKEQEKHHKVARTYEWVHTQVGGYNIPTSRTQAQHGSTNLPQIDPAILNRGRAHLTASPSLELQSVGSESNADLASYRRHSSASDNGGKLVFPAIKTGSAPVAHVKERMSFRDAPVEKSVGWGGGKKRSKRN